MGADPRCAPPLLASPPAMTSSPRPAGPVPPVPGSALRRRLKGIVPAYRAARWLSLLEPEVREGFAAMGHQVGEEWIRARRSPTISPEAIISPLASLRFTERVEIESRANIGPFCCVWGGWSRTWARVGAGTLLSPGVVLVAGNHRLDTPGPVRDTGFDEMDVEVGAGAWVGAHAVVIGCRVGDRAVVG